MTTAMAAFLPCRQHAVPAYGCSAPNFSALPDARATRTRLRSVEPRPNVPPGPEAGRQACEVRPDGRSARASLSTNASGPSSLIHRFPTRPHDSARHPETAGMRALRRYRQLALFVVACLWVLALPAPAVAGCPTACTRRLAALPDPRWCSAGSIRRRRLGGPGHRGIDLAAKPGEVVLAAAAGTVAFVGSIAGQAGHQHRPRSRPHHVRAGDQHACASASGSG